MAQEVWLAGHPHLVPQPYKVLRHQPTKGAYRPGLVMPSWLEAESGVSDQARRSRRHLQSGKRGRPFLLLGDPDRERMWAIQGSGA